MKRGLAIGGGRLVARRAAVVTTVLAIVCGLAGSGIVAYDVLSSTGTAAAPASSTPAAATLTLPPGGTQVLGLTVDSQPTTSNTTSNAPSSSSSSSSSNAASTNASLNTSGAKAAPVSPPPPGPPPFPPGTPPPAAGSSSRSVLLYVRAQLFSQLAGITDKDTKNKAQNAINELDDAIVSTLWSGNPGDGNHVVDKTSNKVFDNVKQAIQQLDGIKKPQPSWVKLYIDDSEWAIRQIATVLISENTCTPDKSKELDTAYKEVAKGDDEYIKLHFPQATDHYQNAWDHAGKAKGEPCAVGGLSVTPTGALFTVTNMVPNDAKPAVVGVKMTGTSGTLTLSEANPTSSACSGCPAGVGTGTDLVHHLNLTVHDDTIGATVYGPAPLDSVGTVNLCALPGCPTSSWTAGEVHTFTFTVTFPNGPDENAYQGASASIDFIWTRS